MGSYRIAFNRQESTDRSRPAGDVRRWLPAGVKACLRVCVPAWRKGRWLGARSPAHARGAPLLVFKRLSINTVGSCAGGGDREWGLRPYPEPPAPAPGWFVTRWCATDGSQGGGGALGRRPHSRSPPRLQGTTVLTALRQARHKRCPASEGRRTGAPPSACRHDTGMPPRTRKDANGAKTWHARERSSSIIESETVCATDAARLHGRFVPARANAPKRCRECR